jgi:mRNA-degrading endonuclease toxin of MazEF toxin-antitoxin module
VELRMGDGGLSKPAVGNVAQMTTVDKSELTERVGRLSAASLGAALRGVRVVITGK